MPNGFDSSESVNMTICHDAEGTDRAHVRGAVPQEISVLASCPTLASHDRTLRTYASGSGDDRQGHQPASCQGGRSSRASLSKDVADGLQASSGMQTKDRTRGLGAMGQAAASGPRGPVLDSDSVAASPASWAVRGELVAGERQVGDDQGSGATMPLEPPWMRSRASAASRSCGSMGRISRTPLVPPRPSTLR